jgi:hypothetical protein
LGGKNHQSRIIYPVEVTFGEEYKRKKFSGERMLKGVVANRPFVE